VAIPATDPGVDRQGSLPARHTGAVAEYEYRSLAMPSGTDRQTARSLLTMHAEYGHWELARLRLWPDGRRHVTLRRKILRQRDLVEAVG